MSGDPNDNALITNNDENLSCTIERTVIKQDQGSDKLACEHELLGCFDDSEDCVGRIAVRGAPVIVDCKLGELGR